MNRTLATNPDRRPLAIGYVRVSTAEQADSRLGLDAQREQLHREADRRGWDLHVIADEGVTGKHTRRDGLQEALQQLRGGHADALLATKVDRVCRSVIDFLGLVETSDREGWQLVVMNLPDADPGNPMAKLARVIFAAFAEVERDLISLRTREALAELKARGVELGSPTTHTDDVLQRIVAARAAGESFGQIATALTADGIPTGQNGARWYPATVKRAAESIRGRRIATGPA